MRLYVPGADSLLERDKRVSGRIRRPMTNEAMRKSVVTMFEMIHELAAWLTSNSRRQHSVETANRAAQGVASPVCRLESGFGRRDEAPEAWRVALEPLPPGAFHEPSAARAIASGSPSHLGFSSSSPKPE